MNLELRSTGVIRRIDDLGRIVVTKEIRRKLCIHEGDPLEALKDAIRDEPLLHGKPELFVKLKEFSELLETMGTEDDHS